MAGDDTVGVDSAGGDAAEGGAAEGDAVSAAAAGDACEADGSAIGAGSGRAIPVGGRVDAQPAANIRSRHPAAINRCINRSKIMP